VPLRRPPLLRPPPLLPPLPLPLLPCLLPHLLHLPQPLLSQLQPCLLLHLRRSPLPLPPLLPQWSLLLPPLQAQRWRVASGTGQGQQLHPPPRSHYKALCHTAS